jgi:hypothetical protein
MAVACAAVIACYGGSAVAKCGSTTRAGLRLHRAVALLRGRVLAPICLLLAIRSWRRIDGLLALVAPRWISAFLPILGWSSVLLVLWESVLYAHLLQR